MPWCTAAASVTGVSHQKAGLPCQDASGYELLPLSEIVIGAVADGAGSASHSGIGAALAVESALRLLKSESLCNENTLPETSEAANVFGRVHEGVLAALNERATVLECPLDQLACTLLAFVATPAGVVAMQIGDGLMVVRARGGEYTLLFKPDRGEYINETTFVTSPAPPTGDGLESKAIQVCVWPHECEFVCASTDGIERVCIRYQDWTPHAPFFSNLEKYMETAPNSEQGSRDIAEFLTRGKLNERTDDDKTLLLCLNKKP